MSINNLLTSKKQHTRTEEINTAYQQELTKKSSKQIKMCPFYSKYNMKAV